MKQSCKYSDFRYPELYDVTFWFMWNMEDISLVCMCYKATFINPWRFNLQTKFFKCIDPIYFTGLPFFFFLRQKVFCQDLCHDKNYFFYWLIGLIGFRFLKYAPSCICCIAIVQLMTKLHFSFSSIYPLYQETASCIPVQKADLEENSQKLRTAINKHGEDMHKK